MRPIVLRRPSAAWLALALVLLVCLALPSMAGAAFPGRNGKIAFAFGVIDTDIYTVNPDGTGATRLTSGQGYDHRPAWSPDGTKIAFERWSYEVPGEIYVMNADGTGVTNVTNSDPAWEEDPSWSPDGSKLAFTEGRDIYTINVDGTSRIRVTTDTGEDSEPAWSPDGGKIAFVSGRDTGFDIYTINPDGTGETRLTNSSPSSEPNWSPDGTRVALRGVDNEIFSINRDGTGRTRLTTNTAVDLGPAWSPDGSRIAFSSQRDGDGDIYTMNPDGTQVRRVTTTGSQPPDYWPSSRPDWQPIPYTGYARPKGATPFRASLVVAYRKCTAPNEQHGPSLAFGSCAPPVQESNWLTTGTSDTNGQATQFVGSLRLDTVVGDPATPADEADVATAMTITDVRNKTDMTDYAGGVQANAVLRMTDQYNSAALGGGADVATVVDIPFPVDATCAATANPAIGSTCSVSSSFEAIVPGAVKEQRRAIWQLGAIEVSDGGSDGNPASVPNTVFARQGLFVP